MKEKLGLEPAFPYIDMEGVIGNTPSGSFGMSNRFYAACAIAPSIINAIMTDKERLESLDIVSKEECITHEDFIIKMVYGYVDELLKQEQLNQNENETNI